MVSGSRDGDRRSRAQTQRRGGPASDRISPRADGAGVPALQGAHHLARKADRVQRHAKTQAEGAGVGRERTASESAEYDG